MQLKSFLSILTVLTLVIQQGYSQYISGVTTPDSTATIVTDTSDIAVQLANTITAADMKAHLSILASDEYQGRETGQPGNDKAAKYISTQLKQSGLTPGGLESAYTQPVAFTFSKWVDTDIYVHKKRYKHLWEYLSFPSQNKSEPAIMAEDVTYLGFGIDDPKYSDYAKNDVKGKIIMIHEGEPMKKDSTYWITRSKTPSKWSDVTEKLKVAKENGVKLVLIIEDDLKALLSKNRRRLIMDEIELGATDDAKLTTANHAYISTNIAKAIAGKKTKKMIKSRNRSNKKGKACDVPMKAPFMINMNKSKKIIESQNVIGIVEGSEKPDEYIIVSAHYDHLGKRGEEIYNGADDNGSGTTTILEIAEAMAKAKAMGKGPKRSVVFLWMTGEEKGLLGSEYYVNNPLIPLEQTIADVNVDMVGRVDEKYADNPHYIYVIGSDRLSTDLHKTNEKVNQKYTQLTLDYTYNDENDPNRYYYRSDHYNFASKGIPSIFFFNGTHDDYHQTSDTVEKINFEKMQSVGRHIFHLVWDLANSPKKIAVNGK